ncbi:hypothetical protein [uncultured Rikenella sp.]|nr:hypothetical protein [uncultured Rikenella sp.]
MGGIGGEGTTWSASTNSSNGVRLYFDVMILNSNTSHHRSYGFLLRCLSE